MRLIFLEAAELIRRMVSGRSRPGLFRCETQEGESAGEYVVKLLARWRRVQSLLRSKRSHRCLRNGWGRCHRNLRPFTSARSSLRQSSLLIPKQRDYDLEAKD